jgi:hypothetical protein
MTRIYEPGTAPVRVVIDALGQPKAFTWEGATHRVASIEEMREPKLEWWAPTGEVHRTYFLLVTQDGMICEVYRDELAAAGREGEEQAPVPGGVWGLARVWD